MARNPIPFVLAPCVGAWGFVLGGMRGGVIALGTFAALVALGTWRVKRRADGAQRSAELDAMPAHAGTPEAAESSPGRLH